nr:AAA family ATPase [uncultured Mediterraneibacter sp.]
MKILKISIENLPHFKKKMDIDFVAQQRVDSDDREYLLHAFSNIYTNPVLSFIGINASGKTTILKVLSFVIELLNNKPINSIESKEILDDMESGQHVTFSSFFYHEGILYKLETSIGKKESPVDGSTKFIILDETLRSKEISRINTKKSLYHFENANWERSRNKNEEYLMEDVSIIVALNKKQDTKSFLFDMSKLTDHNMLNVLGRYPKEILTFLDPSIEYLDCRPGDKKDDIKLKFYGRNEINLNSLLELNRYLSSGTIKGLSVFMGAVFAFQESGYLLVDELENHFNREIVSTLVRFFMDKRINKNGATLIFSTHYSELLDEFERNDGIYIVRNRGGITAENLSNILKRNDIKKSEIYDSGFLKGTVPAYEAYIVLKRALIKINR